MASANTRPQKQIMYYLDMMDGKPDSMLRGQPIVRDARPFGDSRMEMDVYLPASRIGIEYDGSRFHGGDAEQEMRKYASCRDNGIRLYRVTDLDIHTGPYAGTADTLYHVDDPSDITSEIEPMMDEIASELELKNFQGWRKTHQHMDDQLAVYEPVDWTVSKFDDLKDTWDVDRNEYLYDVEADDARVDSPVRYAWRCPRCHEQYMCTVCDRLNGRGCSVTNEGGRHRKARQPVKASFWSRVRQTRR